MKEVIGKKDNKISIDEVAKMVGQNGKMPIVILKKKKEHFKLTRVGWGSFAFIQIDNPRQWFQGEGDVSDQLYVAVHKGKVLIFNDIQDYTDWLSREVF